MHCKSHARERDFRRCRPVILWLQAEHRGCALETQRTIRQINLRIPITTCAGCFVYHETAKRLWLLDDALKLARQVGP
jgi:hypothetical protein